VVLADRVQIQQVIINLVINGIEAMEAVTDRRCSYDGDVR
jgi:C4-dicarboxylate-specific signal transduction histidine kinase